MSWQVGQTTIEVAEGDLITQRTDVIVNAANNDLILGGGLAGIIARKGGPQIQEECTAIGPIEVGGAAITTGGKLPARWVIHAASMRLGGYTTAESLRASTRRSLELAAEKGLRSIAFPAVGTGIARFPMAEAATIMLDEVIRAAQQGTPLELVRFVLFGAEAESVFRREAEARLSPKQIGEEGRRHK